MKALGFLGMVTVLTLSGELPALAQAALQKPSAYAFYNPMLTY